MSLRVLIAGAGLGGLTLAHGLRNAGLDVAVAERGQRATDPAIGYRIHIDSTGSRALHACLPPPVWDLFTAHSAAAPRGIAFATESLRQLAFIETPTHDPIARSHPISRAGLRQILLTGLDDAVTFEKRLECFEPTADGRVLAHFADGSTTTADVLVGADGSGSAVRKQLLPLAHVVDTGVAGIAGKLYLTDAARERVPRQLLSQMTMVLPSRGTGMFLASFQRQAGPGQGDAAALDLPEHLFWVLIGHPRALGLPHDPRREPAATLHTLAMRKVRRWHPFLAWLVGESDPSSLLSVPLHTAQPVAAWRTTNVTLLGDAIHTMPPLQGLGGNTALRDAAVLCHQLVEADRGRVELLPAMHAYEAAMLDYGFEAVKRSVQVSDSVASTNVLARLAFRSVLQVANQLPAVRRRLFERPAANPVFDGATV